LTECEKIESLLWEYPDISPADLERLTGHLAVCPTCSKALATIGAIKESRKTDSRKISAIEASSFDAAVMGKIRKRRDAPARESESRRIVLQLVVPVGLAAAIVIFMIFSISDLANLPVFKDIGISSEEQAGKRYNIINIQLAPEAESQKAPASRQKSDAKRPSEGEFSILAQPVTAPSPDSVKIEAVYLTDETVPLFSQQTRASISEIVVDTGMVQSGQIPIGTLVTVERMPRAVNLILPEYPVWAKKRGLSGEVWVKARIDEKGKVTEAYILSCSYPGAGFEDAALEAARNSRYLPAESNGLKLPVWIMYPVQFINTE